MAKPLTLAQQVRRRHQNTITLTVAGVLFLLIALFSRDTSFAWWPGIAGALLLVAGVYGMVMWHRWATILGAK